MKTKVLFGLATVALLMNVAWNPADSPRPTLLGGAVAHAGIRVDFGFFYNELAPYGYWHQTEPYGWVWYPNVRRSWRPYTVGYWVFTDDYGWTWIAKDPWGSIPFHYGRWFYDDDYGGWAWVPDTEWGPAWVGWRSGGGYIGWAPLPPQARFEPSVGFAPSDRDFGVSASSWCFVPTRKFLNSRVEQVVLPRPRNVTLINNTTNVTRYTVIDRRVVNRSIDIDRFEGETQTRAARYRVDETDQPMRRESPVRNGRVVLFRPEVVRTTAAPPPPAVRPPRMGARPDRYPEQRFPGAAPWEHRPGDRDQDRRDRGTWSNANRPPPQDSRSVEFEERDDRRSSTDQEQHRQRLGTEQQFQDEQRQKAEQEQNRQRTDQERAQRQTEREQARQQQQQQQQQQKQQEQAQQREQERAQRQAEREQARQQQQQQQKQQEQAQQREQERAQRQTEREQARQQQQQQQQAEQEQAQRRAGQEQARQRATQQQQQAEQEQARQRADQERTQRQAEREQARQQQMEQERARRQAEREAQRQAEQAQRQAEREARRQAEREQARQQAIQQQPAEQERQRRRNLPECKSLPPGQQQECR